MLTRTKRQFSYTAFPPSSIGRLSARASGKRDGSDIASGKRDGSDIVKLGGPADVRAIFTRARHFDFGPPFAGDPWDDRPTLGPNVAQISLFREAGQREAGQVRYC